MKTVNDRIKYLIESHLDISPYAFAGSVGYFPNGIYQILEGRNKPAYKLISNILEKYPQISADWLLMGTGSMLKEDNKIGTVSQQLELISQATNKIGSLLEKLDAVYEKVHALYSSTHGDIISGKKGAGEGADGQVEMTKPHALEFRYSYTSDGE